jgi:hypothetical protein
MRFHGCAVAPDSNSGRFSLGLEQNSMNAQRKSRHKNHHRTPSTPLALVPTTVRPFQIPVQPRNSTIQCFLLYPFNKLMLPFTMRSVSILAFFTGRFSCGPRSCLGMSSSALSVLRTQCSLCSAFFATLFFSAACTLLVSLAALFRPRPLCFQWLADSFAKYRGVGAPLHCSCPRHACIFLSATWTRPAHPTIIASRLRLQV